MLFISLLFDKYYFPLFNLYACVRLYVRIAVCPYMFSVRYESLLAERLPLLGALVQLNHQYPINR